MIIGIYKVVCVCAFAPKVCACVYIQRCKDNKIFYSLAIFLSFFCPNDRFVVLFARKNLVSIAENILFYSKICMVS